MKNKELSPQQQKDILSVLKLRIEKNTFCLNNLKWPKLQEKLIANKLKLWALHEMEATSGEPNVIEYNTKTDEYTFYDCAKESPKGRRSVCYDREALESRKKFKPKNNAIDMAEAIGIEILNEQQYRELQEMGDFDTKTSSWIKTPNEIRELGGAIFADFRFGNVFIYHNGAESYYASRGFRGALTV